MAFAKPRADAQNGASGFDARARKLFLEHLALTSNVAASARKAGVVSSRVYVLKRKNPDFARDWQVALSEGFARLEAELLAEALRTISGKVSDATLKSRAQKHRLRWRCWRCTAARCAEGQSLLQRRATAPRLLRASRRSCVTCKCV